LPAVSRLPPYLLRQSAGEIFIFWIAVTMTCGRHHRFWVVPILRIDTITLPWDGPGFARNTNWVRQSCISQGPRSAIIEVLNERSAGK
jgi:hypothetical protein